MTRSRIKRLKDSPPDACSRAKRGLAACDGLRLITETMTKAFKELPLDGIVVGDQDSCGHAASEGRHCPAAGTVRD